MSIELAPHKNPDIDRLTEAKRLRWVLLEFSRLDLEVLTSEELEALGDKLRHAAAPWWVDRRGCTTMPAAQVLALQQEIRQGIQAVVGESLSFAESVQTSMNLIRPGGWAIQGSRYHIVRGQLDGDEGPPRVWRVSESTDERMAILEGVATLLVKFGDRLCTCPVCGTLFLRQYRQEYCTVRCSNKVRNKRRLDKKTHQWKTGRLVTTRN
jgi:hypothetical protein